MKRIIYILLFLVITLSGCNDELRNLNTNPEILDQTQPEYLFAGATQNFMNSTREHLISRYSGVMTFMQYLVATDGASSDTYIPQNKSTNIAGPGMSFIWSDFFEGTGRSLRQLIRVIDQHEFKDSYQSLRAVAQMLEVQQAWMVMDWYGAMPYTEGLQAVINGGTQTPKYDYIWELYKFFDETIKKQVEVLNTATGQKDVASYDYFYNGDWKKWAKFGNSLRIKMALRFEHRDPDFLKSVVNEIAQDDAGIMENMEDGCWYHHPSDYNDVVDDILYIRSRYNASEAFVNTLKYTEDPRLPLMVRRNYYEDGYEDYELMKKNASDSLLKYNPDGERYLGMPASPYAANEGKSSYGNRMQETVSASWQEGGTKVSKSVRLISQIQGRLFVKNGGFKSGETDPLASWISNDKIKMSTCILSYADLCFTIAEIAEKYGLTALGAAGDWYMKGVTASINRYIALSVDAAVPAADIQACRDKVAAYLSSPMIQYTGSQAQKLEKIYSQAWINNLKQPEEAYAMWKRTGYPAFRDWNPGEVVTVGYLDRLYGASSRDESGILLIPRRGVIPQRDENYTHWEASWKGQQQKDPAYGENESDTRGRIWWDHAGVEK